MGAFAPAVATAGDAAGTGVRLRPICAPEVPVPVAVPAVVPVVAYAPLPVWLTPLFVPLLLLLLPLDSIECGKDCCLEIKPADSELTPTPGAAVEPAPELEPELGPELSPDLEPALVPVLEPVLTRVTAEVGMGDASVSEVTALAVPVPEPELVPVGLEAVAAPAVGSGTEAAPVTAVSGS